MRRVPAPSNSRNASTCSAPGGRRPALTARPDPEGGAVATIGVPPPAEPVATLVKVPFHEGVLHAVRVGGDIWISIRRVCEDLGIDPLDQIKKLKKKPWATEVLITSQLPGDTQRRKIACIHLDCLPMWLATIHLSRANAAAGPRLLRFQIEAARVLRDHFFGLGDSIPSWVDPADPCPRRTVAASLAGAEGVPAENIGRVCAGPADTSRSVASWVLEMSRAGGSERPARPSDAVLEIVEALRDDGFRLAAAVPELDARRRLAAARRVLYREATAHPAPQTSELPPAAPAMPASTDSDGLVLVGHAEQLLANVLDPVARLAVAEIRGGLALLRRGPAKAMATAGKAAA